MPTPDYVLLCCKKRYSCILRVWDQLVHVVECLTCCPTESVLLCDVTCDSLHAASRLHAPCRGTAKILSRENSSVGRILGPLCRLKDISLQACFIPAGIRAHKSMKMRCASMWCLRPCTDAYTQLGLGLLPARPIPTTGTVRSLFSKIRFTFGGDIVHSRTKFQTEAVGQASQRPP